MATNVSSEIVGMSESLTSMLGISMVLVVVMGIIGFIFPIINRIFKGEEESEREIDVEIVESEEESNNEDFENGDIIAFDEIFEDKESEEKESFKGKEVFHKIKSKEQPEVKIPESKMTEKDFNRSEFD